MTITDINGCSGNAGPFVVGVTFIPGCMDTLACNYNPLATSDDGSTLLEYLVVWILQHLIIML